MGAALQKLLSHLATKWASVCGGTQNYLCQILWGGRPSFFLSQSVKDFKGKNWHLELHLDTYWQNAVVILLVYLMPGSNDAAAFCTSCSFQMAYKGSST